MEAGTAPNVDLERDQVNLFMLMTIFSLFLSLPFATLDYHCVSACAHALSSGEYKQEARPIRYFFTQAVHALTKLLACTLQLVHQVAAVAFSFHLYQLLSFIILARITPVAHSVANCMKRVVVILYALLTTDAKVKEINAAGIAVALLGVTGYSVLAK